MTTSLMLFFKNYFTSFRRLNAASWRGIGFCFFESMVGGVCFFLAIYFVQVLHLSILDAGIILSSYGFGRAAGGIVGGKLSDFFSEKAISIVSLLLQGIAFFVLVYLNKFHLLVADLFLLGASSYGFITANSVWVLRQCEKEENAQLKGINFLYSASNLGLGLSALLIGLLKVNNFPIMFYAASLVLFLAAGALVFEKDTRGKENIASVIREKEKETQKTDSLLKRKGIKIVFVMLGSLFLMSLVVSQLNATYLYYIHTTFSQVSFMGIGSLFSLNPLLIVFFQVPLLSFLGNKNKILMVGISSLLLGFGMALLGFPNLFLFAILSCLIFTCGEMIYFSMLQLVIYRETPPNKKGQALGLYRTVYAIGTIVGPVLGGFIYHSWNTCVLWFGCGLVGLISFLICVWYKKEEGFYDA